jgi:hypothetical protein
VARIKVKYDIEKKEYFGWMYNDDGSLVAILCLGKDKDNLKAVEDFVKRNGGTNVTAN